MLNLTPHEVVIRPDQGNEIRVPPSGDPLRLSEVDHVHNTPRGGALMVGETAVRVVDRHFSTPLLPAGDEPKLVSLPILMALGEKGIYRPDLFAPDTGSTCIRDAKGRIEAVTRLVRLWTPREHDDGARVIEVGSPEVYGGTGAYVLLVTRLGRVGIGHCADYIRGGGWPPGWQDAAKEVEDALKGSKRHYQGRHKSGLPAAEAVARQAAIMVWDRLREPVAVCCCELSRSGPINVMQAHWTVSKGGVS